MMNVYFLRVIPPYIWCMNPRKTQQWYQSQVLCHGLLLFFKNCLRMRFLVCMILIWILNKCLSKWSEPYIIYILNKLLAKFENQISWFGWWKDFLKMKIWVLIFWWIFGSVLELVFWMTFWSPIFVEFLYVKLEEVINT